MPASRAPASSVNSKYDKMMKMVALTARPSQGRRRAKSSSDSDSGAESAQSLLSDAYSQNSREEKRLGKELTFLKLGHGRESSASVMQRDSEDENVATASEVNGYISRHDLRFPYFITYS
jgi:hypothetical protein